MNIEPYLNENNLTIENIEKGILSIFRKEYFDNKFFSLDIDFDEFKFPSDMEEYLNKLESKNINIINKDENKKIIESKSIGADAILLIASILDKEEIKNYSSLAKSLGLEVLLEIHSIDELNKISNTDVDIIGVNNRNLDTLDINIENSIEMFENIPSEFIKISESGISKVDSIIKLIRVGYDGFLIGENFMKTSKPGESAYDFIKKVENKKIYSNEI